MKKNIFLVSLLIVAIFVTGCGSKGTLVMQITDAPSDLNIEKALVTISNIEVHVAGAEETSGWVTVVEGAKTFDLMKLVGVTDLLGEAQLDVGKYTQVRLNLESAKVTIDSQEFDLEVPSDKLKLVKGFDIIAGETTKLTFDFDAKESIIATGAGDYKLKPTIKVLSETELNEKLKE